MGQATSTDPGCVYSPTRCACRLHSTIDRWPQCPQTSSPPRPDVRGCKTRERRSGAVAACGAALWCMAAVAVCWDQGVTTHTSAQSASGEVTSSHVDPAVSNRAALAVLRRTACLAKAEAACKQMHRRQKEGLGNALAPQGRCRTARAGVPSLSAAHKAWQQHFPADTHAGRACAAMLHEQAASLQPRLVHPAANDLTSSQPLLCPTHITQKFCASLAMLRIVSSRWCLVWPSSAATVYRLPK